MVNFHEFYAGKTVAITGASGYLAGAILNELGTQVEEVLRISRQPLEPLPGTKTLQADVREAGCWETIVSASDVIFHLASNTSVYAAVEDPVASLNATVLPVVQLIHAARKYGRQPTVIVAGTATQYGLTSSHPVTEETPLRPITNYDLHKCQMEAQLLLASQHGLVRGTSLRLANVYGPATRASSANDRGVLNKMTRLALLGKPITVYGGGGYVRDYVYVRDVARAFLATGAAPAAVGRAFNVASGVGVSVNDAFRSIAEAAARKTGKQVSVLEVPWPTDMDPIEKRNFIGSIVALREATGWQPEVSFAGGVERMLAQFYSTMAADESPQ